MPNVNGLFIADESRTSTAQTSIAQSIKSFLISISRCSWNSSRGMEAWLL